MIIHEHTVEFGLDEWLQLEERFGRESRDNRRHLLYKERVGGELKKLRKENNELKAAKAHLEKLQVPPENIELIRMRRQLYDVIDERNALQSRINQFKRIQI